MQDLSEAGSVEIREELRMAGILTWLLWGSSAAVTSLASADLLLLDRQKKWVNDRAIDFWSWLDDQRHLKYLSYLSKFRWQKFVVILYGAVALIMAIFIGYGIYTGGFHDAGVPLYFEHYLLGLYVGSFVAALFMVRIALPLMLDWVTKTEGSWAYIWRSSLVLIATAVAALASMGLLSLSMNPGTAPPTSASSPQDWATYLWSFSSPITAFLNGFCGSLIITLSLLILTSWVLIVLPVIFVIMLTILFRAAEFVTVRIAENSKGPQYVLSVLLAAVGYAVSLIAA
jgi:hypothetical protein